MVYFSMLNERTIFEVSLLSLLTLITRDTSQERRLRMSKVKKANYFNQENSYRNHRICNKLFNNAHNDVWYIKDVKDDIRKSQYLYDCLKSDLNALQNNQINAWKKQRQTPEMLSLSERMLDLGAKLNAWRTYLLDVKKAVA